MAASPARIAANRKNAQQSTGPKTPEGKARSRANALEHGMAGTGIALPTEDRALIEARFLGLRGDGPLRRVGDDPWSTPSP